MFGQKTETYFQAMQWLELIRNGYLSYIHTYLLAAPIQMLSFHSTVCQQCVGKQTAKNSDLLKWQIPSAHRQTDVALTFMDREFQTHFDFGVYTPLPPSVEPTAKVSKLNRWR